MAVILSSVVLKDVLTRLHKSPGNREIIGELVTLLQPLAHMTLQRFPRHLGDDIEQELLLTITKKADFLAEKYCSGSMKTPTNYMMTLFKNAATVYLNKELKHDTHLVSIDDVKVDKAYLPKEGQRHHVVETIRQEVLDFIRIRFPKKSDAIRAERYVDVILNGLRPSFTTGNIHKFYGGRQAQAKDAYSVVLQKIRERLEAHWPELFN